MSTQPANASNKKFAIAIAVLVLAVTAGVTAIYKYNEANPYVPPQNSALPGKPDTLGTCWQQTATQMIPISCDSDKAMFVTAKVVTNYHGCTDYYVKADAEGKFLCLDPKK